VGQQLLGIRCSSTRVVVADSEVPCAASEQRRTLPQDLDPEKNPFIHSFRIFLWHLFKSITTQRRSRHSTDTVPEFHTEVLQATVSEGLAQGPYVAAGVEFESVTLRTQGTKHTTEPPCPTFILQIILTDVKESEFADWNYYQCI